MTGSHETGAVVLVNIKVASTDKVNYFLDGHHSWSLSIGHLFSCFLKTEAAKSLTACHSSLWCLTDSKSMINHSSPLLPSTRATLDMSLISQETLADTVSASRIKLYFWPSLTLDTVISVVWPWPRPTIDHFTSDFSQSWW